MLDTQTTPIPRRPLGGPCSQRAHQSSLAAERRRRQDALLDEALLETFPASDPISVMQIT